ncbi:MAG: hypothetical protein AAF710_10535 [Planctomycetota bacterium]
MDRARPDPRTARGRAAGFSLPEALLASAVLAFAVAGLTQAVVSGQAHTHHALHEARALALAEAMIDEVLSKPYADPDGHTVPGADAGEVGRDDFDAMDDYDGYAEAAGGLTDPAGDAYPDDYGGFTRSVAAAYTTRDVAAFGGSRAGLAVTVTVTDSDTERPWRVSRFVAEPAS